MRHLYNSNHDCLVDFIIVSSDSEGKVVEIQGLHVNIYGSLLLANTVYII